MQLSSTHLWSTAHRYSAGSLTGASSLSPSLHLAVLSAVRPGCPLHLAVRGILCGWRQVCENIVIPNIRIRADQEEMFELNWVEYVRRDTEGSDSDTRRRAATELVRALTERFPTEARSQQALRAPCYSTHCGPPLSSPLGPAMPFCR